MHKSNLAILLSSLVILVCLSSFQIKAQNIDRKEQLESQKVAFFTKELNLTVEEAQAFWPIHNEYQQKNEALTKSRRKLLKQIENNDNLSDKELVALSDEYITLQSDEAKLAAVYHEKFKAVLPIRKVIAYYKAEYKYKRFLLQQFQKNKRVDND